MFLDPLFDDEARASQSTGFSRDFICMITSLSAPCKEDGRGKGLWEAVCHAPMKQILGKFPYCVCRYLCWKWPSVTALSTRALRVRSSLRLLQQFVKDICCEATILALWCDYKTSRKKVYAALVTINVLAHCCGLSKLVYSEWCRLDIVVLLLLL